MISRAVDISITFPYQALVRMSGRATQICTVHTYDYFVDPKAANSPDAHETAPTARPVGPAGARDAAAPRRVAG
jgi:hypothetical protein